MSVGLHVFHHVLLQYPPQRALVGAVELKPEQTKKLNEAPSPCFKPAAAQLAG